MDYLQVEGIASRSSLRYPTRSWFRDHFILPEHHGFTDVELQALGREGVDLREKTVSQVPGMWILNGYTKKSDDNEQEIVRHVKLLEVGEEGTARRASLLRKQAPDRFQDKRWNGSPSCLQISRTEFLEQFLYMKNGRYRDMTEEQMCQVCVGDIGLSECPSEADCIAKYKHCGPCGGTYGLLYPCMLCTNWTHIFCAYSAEGGLICASHVAVLDCAEGLMV
eukprot:3350593-Amphidinium_carterae.1